MSLQLSLALILTIGLLISYIPQQYNLLRQKSTTGISGVWLLCSGVASTCTVFNVALLSNFNCHGDWSTCLVSLLALIQVSLQWLMVYIIIVLWLVYHPRIREAIPRTREANPRTQEATPRTREAIPRTQEAIPRTQEAIPRTQEASHVDERTPLIAPPTPRTPTTFTTTPLVRVIPPTLTLVLLLNLALTLALTLSHTPTTPFANTLGIVSSVLATIQFIPQIYTTYHLKHVGALSIPMMLIQCPGSFLFAFSLYMQDGVNLSSYLSYLCSGSLQFVLLVLAIYYSLAESDPANSNTAESNVHSN